MKTKVEKAAEKAADFALLDAWLTGDPLAAEDLATRIMQIIWLCAFDRARKIGLRLFSEHDAWDISQEIITDLFQSNGLVLRQFERRSSLSHWMHVLVRNKLIDRKRSVLEQMREESQQFDNPTTEDKKSPTWEDVLSDLSIMPSDRLMEKEQLEQVRAAVSELLTDRDKRILAMWYTYEYSYKQIGEAFGITGNGVASVINRAVAGLKEFLKVQELDSV